MSTKTLLNLNIIVLITFCVSCNLHSQSPTITTVRKYDYPLPSGIIVPDIVSNPYNVKNLPDSIIATSPKGYQYIEFYAQFVLPYEPYLTSLFVQGRNAYPRSVLFKRLQGNKIAFIMDADGDDNFLEEKVDTIPVNKPTLIMRELMLTKDGQPCPFMLPLEIQIDYEGEKFVTMSVKNLLKYQLNYLLGKDTLLIDIRTHQHNVQCYLYQHTPKDTILHFRLNEPFLYKGIYYRLTNLDLCDNTLILEQLGGDKINGYKEGFYLDMIELRKLTDKNMMDGSSIHWREKPYTLLHFWGEWCNPCRDEIPDLNALDQHLEAGRQVQMVHYPFVFKKELLGRTLTFIRENNLSPHQSFCISGNCSVDETVKEQCDVCTFARVIDFPKYILLDRQGKILFMNERGGVQVAINKLKALGLY